MAISSPVGSWIFGHDGTTTFPSNNLHTNNDLTIQASGIPATVTAITYSTGGWDGVSGVNVPTTGGTGSGLFVNVSEGGSGYADAVVVLTPGNGYSNGDLITATRGGASVQFTISILPAKNWTFGADGNLTVPTGGAITASDANVHIAGNIVLGSNGNITFSDSTIQTTAYQVVKSAWNTQYPSVRMGNALFNIDNAGNPTVGAVSGTWTGGYTAVYQTAAGSYLALGTGSASATWSSVASYGFGVTFAAAGDQAIGYFSDDTNGQMYRATWIAGSSGPSTGYGYIQVEQLV